MCKEREYSFANPVFSAEAATLLPVVFKPTPTLDTQTQQMDNPNSNFVS